MGASKPGLWTPMAMMTEPRSGACAAPLRDGRVLIAGGVSARGVLNSAELFDVNSGFSAAAEMSTGRNTSTCVTLQDGRVLVAGGADAVGSLSTTEIFDPIANRWSKGGDMAYSRSGHTATRLKDGRVLLAGGEGQGAVRNTLEIFDPVSNSFGLATTATLSFSRKEHAAALLPDGRVLIAGGSDGSSALASTEIYDAVKDQLSAGPQLASSRSGLSATALMDGNILIAGGNDGSNDLATAEIFDAIAGKFDGAAKMTAPRHGHLAFLLPNNNQVLLIGGDQTNRSTELFTPWRNAFSATSGSTEARRAAIASTLDSEGLLLLSGGSTGNRALDSSSLYRFPTLTATQEDNALKIAGSGWQPGDQVTLLTQHQPKTREDLTKSVKADATGRISDSQPLAQTPGRFTVTATSPMAAGQTGGSTGANLDQCANGAVANPQTNTLCAGSTDWVNGNLGASKAHYLEGDSIPYRLTMTNVSLASHKVTIEWDTTQGGKHALDYITTYNRTQPANPCAGISGCGSPTVFAIPADPNVTSQNVTPVSGNFTLFGGSITAASVYTLSGLYSGNSSTRITITFTASVANPVLAWGGHIATRLDWGAANSAIAISGSPYHTRLIDLDGSGGNQDRALSSDAAIFPASIKIVKVANVSGSPITTQGFDFTASPTPLSGFTLCGANTCDNTFANITTFQTYTVTEAVASGWTFDSLSCTVSGGTSTTPPSSSTTTVSISLKEGDNVVCTYTNHRLAATLIVKKHVVIAHGGTKAAGDFTMLVTGTNVSMPSFSGSETGTTVTVDPGSTYSVDESPVSGYTKAIGAGCSGTIAAGATVTCTITNSDQAATLTVVKVVSNTHNGSKHATDFSFIVNGGSATAFLQDTDQDHGKNTLTVNAGTYNIAEVGVPISGYATTYSNCSSVVLSNGGTATCTIANSDQAATLTVVKVVSNTHGGTKHATDFSFTVNAGPTTAFLQDTDQDHGKNTLTMNAGTYNIAEVGVPISGYTTTYSNCSSVVLSSGGTATCTITNSDQAATLTVVKVVSNTHGGTKHATDFSFIVNGGTATAFLQDTDQNHGKNTLTVNAGTYSIVELGVPISGYDTAYSTTCSGVLSNGGTATCTITNSDQVATLIVSKTCAAASDPTMFSVNADANPLTTLGCGGMQTITTLSAGQHSITEVAPGGIWNQALNSWTPPATPGAFTGPDCAGGNVTLVNGQTKVCFVLNLANYCTPQFPPTLNLPVSPSPNIAKPPSTRTPVRQARPRPPQKN